MTAADPRTITALLRGIVDAARAHQYEMEVNLEAALLTAVGDGPLVIPPAAGLTAEEERYVLALLAAGQAPREACEEAIEAWLRERDRLVGWAGRVAA
jgi:hypothetical protein